MTRGKKTEARFKKMFEKFGPMRLQNNVAAHQVTLADYFFQTKIWDVMVECKSVACGILDISRVTQEYRLKEWTEKQSRNRSYIFFDWSNTYRKDMYLIDIVDWIRLKPSNRSTISYIEFARVFKDFNKISMFLESETI